MYRRIGIMILFLVFSLMGTSVITQAYSEVGCVAMSDLGNETEIVPPTFEKIFKGKSTTFLRSRKTVFLPSDKKIVWWAEFKPLTFFKRQELKARWYEPKILQIRKVNGSWKFIIRIN